MPTQAVQYTVEIVKSYLSKNPLPAQEVSGLLVAVHQALAAPVGRVGTAPIVESGSGGAEVLPTFVPDEPLVFVPIVPVAEAVTQDSIFCLICGKASKAIRGHLSKTHRIDIPTYRGRYGLPKDFPMVAPSYSEARRRLAVAASFGEK